MPPGSRRYELEDADSILKAATVIAQNQVYCGEALDILDTASMPIVLSSPCRRIRVVIDGVVSGTWGIWFSWGKDHTDHPGGRVMVTVQAPLDIVLDNPEDHFWVRRIGSTATVNVSIMGVF